MEDIIKKFTENLIEKLHLSNLPSDQRQKYVEQMSAQAQQRLGLMVMSKLAEEDLITYESMLTDDVQPQPDKLLAWLREKITNFDKEVENSLQTFTEEVAKDFLSIQSAISNKS